MRHLAVTAAVAVGLFACAAANRKAPSTDVLRESWRAYAGRFIQKDGRVIDRSAHDVTTSEGQAYAMLRAVWMDDRATFDRTYQWAVNNLNAGIRQDHLWAWKWGQDSAGRWHALDSAFATDADQDAATALILASNAWHDPRYLRNAQAMLGDLWDEATVVAAGHRYLLAGDSLCKGTDCRVNPSYYAPYAYRLFAARDRSHNWGEMVDASYAFLDRVSALTATHLPPDWARLNTATGALRLGSPADSVFSYDALRVFWRVALDAEVNRDRRAEAYLLGAGEWLDREWARRRLIPAVISAAGKGQVEYQSFEMLAAILPAIRLIAPQDAAEINAKLESIYANGIWGEPNNYYLQNWAWFGAALYAKKGTDAFIPR